MGIKVVIFLEAIDGLIGSNKYPNDCDSLSFGGLNGPHLSADGLKGCLGGCDVARIGSDVESSCLFCEPDASLCAVAYVL